MRKIVLFCTLVVCLLGSCSHKKTEPEVEIVDTIPMMVMQIQKCSRMYAAECQVHKIITHTDKKQLAGEIMNHKFKINLPLGSRNIAIPVEATVKAYIDFSAFSEKHVQRNGDKIEIILPDPKLVLTATKIDHDGIKQYVPLMRSRFTDAELTGYASLGRDAIIRELPGLGIVEAAKLSAARTLIPLIEQLGYPRNNITVTFRRPFTPADLRSFITSENVENHGNTQQ